MYEIQMSASVRKGLFGRQPRSLVSVLPVAAFVLLLGESRVTTDAVNPAKPKIFTLELSYYHGAVGTFKKKKKLADS